MRIRAPKRPLLFIMRWPIIFIASLVVTTACRSIPSQLASTETTKQIQLSNLHMFARLYGVLRWFHPSDAASTIDWDRFAVEGVSKAMHTSTTDGFRAALKKMIEPIAPTVRFTDQRQNAAVVGQQAVGRSSGADVVAWQHRGYGDTGLGSPDDLYLSKRTHRPGTAPVARVPFFAIYQAVDASALRGARVRLRGRVRAAHHAQGQLWLRVDRPQGAGFFDNMDQNAVTDIKWQSAGIVGPVAADATRVVFGIVMDGVGTTWYDDLELSVESADHTWKSIEIRDPGFETDDILAAWRPGVGRADAGSIEGWNATLDANDPASGRHALRVEAATKTLTADLFPEAPRWDEIIDVELGSGLHARVPLALSSDGGHTIGDHPDVAQKMFGTALAAPTKYDTVFGIADVVVAWNALEHFWPYWESVSVDWLSELDVALADALDDRTVDDHVATLERLSAAAPDGHASTTCRGETPQVGPPFIVEVIEQEVVVTASAANSIQRGDVVVSVDGRSATSLLAADEALASGSKQWRQVAACSRFAAGAAGAELSVVVRRSGAELAVQVERGAEVEEVTRPAIEHLQDGVYYIDLNRAAWGDIEAEMPKIARAPGVVFDVRNAPRGNFGILSYLARLPIEFNEGMTIPHIIRPDHARDAIPTWEAPSHVLPVLVPHIDGRVAFVTGPTAISSAESLISLVERHHLGEIVGSATAGTNGDVAQILEPSGCRTTFTGLRVTKRNNALLHLVGIAPTIPASRTIAGVAASRDEVLEAALAFVRRVSSSKQP